MSEALFLEKQFTDETVNAVRHDDHMIPLGRTPLYVEFSHRSNCVPASTLEPWDYRQSETFNAIGSANYFTTGQNETTPLHLPVLDIDGGAETFRTRHGSKAIIYPLNPNQARYPIHSDIREILGDNDIDLEIMQSSRPGNGSVVTNLAALVLRSKSPAAFVAAESTQNRHSHLYIQQSFSHTDHFELLANLVELNIVSPAWHRLTVQEGMGIVRTPWTKKDLSHMPS